MGTLETRRSASLALAMSAAVLLPAVPTAAHAATLSGGRTAAPASSVIPVWAYLNGAYPVRGGRVMIVARGRTVRQLSPPASGRTNRNGVALVSVRRVPRRFTVVVRGGRAAGRRLLGGLRSLAGSAPGVGVVEVNPLTALVTELRRQRPRLGFRQASRAVKRYFGVPWWTDLGQNLRDGPQWFSAGAYLRSARRYGSIDRLDRAVARRILCGSTGLRRISRVAADNRASGTVAFNPGVTTARIGSVGQLVEKGSKLSGGQFVRKIFKLLGETAAGTAAQGVVGGVLGGLLELTKAVGITVPKSEFEEAQEQLSAIGAQITQLQGQVSDLSQHLRNSEASRLIHHSDAVIAHIKTATGQLAALAEADGTPKQRQNLADDIEKYIFNNLLNAPETLNLHLNPELPLGNNAIKATSEALATSSRFFDARQSDEVRAVYDYFATYQAELAVLLTNYWNTRFSANYITTELEKLRVNVTETQQTSLKPTVPAGAFFDTRTPRFMWATDGSTVSALDVLDRHLQTWRNLKLGGFDNYQMPATGDFRNLLDGSSGNSGNPREWLQSQVKVRLSHQLVWTSGSVKARQISYGSGPRLDLAIRIFDLATGREEQHGYGNSPWTYVEPCQPDRCNVRQLTVAGKDFLASKSGGLLLLRYLAPGERYWW